MKRLLGPSLTAITILACGESTLGPPDRSSENPGGPEFAPAVTQTQHNEFEVSFVDFIPCSNGGAGELVSFSGPLNELLHVTFTANGHATVKSQLRFQGISGTGQITGDRWDAVGVRQDLVTLFVGTEITFVNNYRLIAAGKGSNLSIHENFHLKLDADGVVTTSHDNFRADCK